MILVRTIIVHFSIMLIMIEQEILKSIFNKDIDLARKIYLKDKKEITNILKKTRLSNFFLELLDLNEDNKDKLEKIKNRILHRNIVILDEVKTLSKLFNDEGINYSFIKGASSILSFKELMSRRFTSDIDVLIDINHFKQLHTLLSKQEFNPIFDYTYDYSKSKLNHSFEKIKLKSGLVVDFHFRITDPLHFKNCPLTKYVLDNSIHLKNFHNIRITNETSIYLNALYQIFLKKESDISTGSYVDLVYLKQNVNLNNKVTMDVLKNSFLYEHHKFLEEFLVYLVKANKERSSKMDKFSKRIFKQKHFNFIHSIKLRYLNILYFNELKIEKYGYLAKKNNLYFSFKFFYDKFIKFLLYCFGKN